MSESAARHQHRPPIWAWILVGLAVVVLIAGIILRATDNLPVPGKSATNSLVDSGRAHLEAGDFPAAISDLTAAVAKIPNDSQAHFLLGQAYNRSGDPLKAADEFQAVLEIDPENAAAHHNLGVTYFQLQDASAAIAEFNAALEVDPDNADTHYQLGATYLVLSLSRSADTSTELVAQAISEFELALSLREDMPEALIGMANIQIQEGNYADAIEMLLRAIEQVPDSPEAHYALAEAYARGGQVARACDVYKKFLDLNPPTTWGSRAREQMSAIGCE